ncbi:hypothetical protein N2152v2_001939 [Parachlorella kessleri]
MQSLENALTGLPELVDKVKREAAASRAESEHWRKEYEKEQERIARLEAELAACQAKLEQAKQRSGATSPCAGWCSPKLPPRSAMLGRRSTITLGQALEQQQKSAGGMVSSGFWSSRALRVNWGRAQEPQPQDSGNQQQQGQGRGGPLRRQSSFEEGSGVLTISRLSRFLGAALLLESTAGAARTAEAGGSTSPRDGEQEEMARQESSFEGQAQVSLLDDGGGAGVGATAAAAVSVALAKSWAAAAGASGSHNLARLQRQGSWGQRGATGASGADGASEGGGQVQQRQAARFKLVAAVPRNEARRTKMKVSESRATLSESGGDTPTARSSHSGSGSLFPSDSTMHLDNLTPASPRGLDDDQEATWRACGSHLKLQWLSPPSTVLVTYKPVPAVLHSCVRAVGWLLRRGLRVFVEPAVHAELSLALAEHLGKAQHAQQAREGAGRGTAEGAAADGDGAAADDDGAEGRKSGDANGAAASDHGGSGGGGRKTWEGGSPFESGAAAPGGPHSRGKPPLPSSAGGGVRHAAPHQQDGKDGRSSNPGASSNGSSTASAGHDRAVTFRDAVNGSAASNGSSPSGGSPTAHNGHARGGHPSTSSGVTAAPPSAHSRASHVDLEAQLRTWDPCGCCDNILPAWVADQLDLVITLGGDGTVLWTCAMFSSGAVPPIVPFAMGSLGFMTPFPIERMEHCLSRTTSAEHGFPLMLRHRLQCRILRAGQPDGGSSGDLAHHQLALPPPLCGDEMVVLNEVVIDRGATASLTNLQVYVDQNFVTTIQGDGLIVATPTGSTAYSLAAGGSMVHPGVPALLFTPICPHTISSRPLVFPEHVVLRVKVPVDSRSEAYCSFDGRARQPLWPGDSVLIRMSPWPVPMVCSLDASHDWFLSVREGLNWNLRKVQGGKGS